MSYCLIFSNYLTAITWLTSVIFPTFTVGVMSERWPSNRKVGSSILNSAEVLTQSQLRCNYEIVIDGVQPMAICGNQSVLCDSLHSIRNVKLRTHWYIFLFQQRKSCYSAGVSLHLPTAPSVVKIAKQSMNQTSLSRVPLVSIEVRKS